MSARETGEVLESIALRRPDKAPWAGTGTVGPC